MANIRPGLGKEAVTAIQGVRGSLGSKKEADLVKEAVRVAADYGWEGAQEGDVQWSYNKDVKPSPAFLTLARQTSIKGPEGPVLVEQTVRVYPDRVIDIEWVDPEIGEFCRPDGRPAFVQEAKTGALGQVIYDNTVAAERVKRGLPRRLVWQTGEGPTEDILVADLVKIDFAQNQKGLPIEARLGRKIPGGPIVWAVNSGTVDKPNVGVIASEKRFQAVIRDAGGIIPGLHQAFTSVEEFEAVEADGLEFAGLAGELSGEKPVVRDLAREVLRSLSRPGQGPKRGRGKEPLN